MHEHANWRSAIAVSCSFTIVLLLYVWHLRKGNSPSERKKGTKNEENEGNNETTEAERIENDEKEVTTGEKVPDDRISELPVPNWRKVGQVAELYYYPLKSGRGKEVNECNFTERGISVEKPGCFTLRDRMFLVYNEETGRFQTGRNYPTLILVSLSSVDETRVKLEAVGMPSVVFRVPEHDRENYEAIECKMWWGEIVKCIDCGHQPAEWLSRFLTGTNSGLRLGYAITNGRHILEGPWEKITKVYNNLRNEDAGFFSDLSSYMLMTVQSVENLNEKLERPVPALQFRPNILVSAQDAFQEDKWEWIKIGSRAVIRNVKPCNRCKMVRINPETGAADKEEPLKTLQSFREQTDPERVSVDGKSPVLGIYCGLYLTGNVKTGDDVFVHVPNEPKTDPEASANEQRS